MKRRASVCLCAFLGFVSEMFHRNLYDQHNTWAMKNLVVYGFYTGWNPTQWYVGIHNKPP